MVGHGSAVTTANSVTCPPRLGATNSGFPMILSTVRLAEDEAGTAGITEEIRGREMYCVSMSEIMCMHVCVCKAHSQKSLQKGTYKYKKCLSKKRFRVFFCKANQSDHED